MVRGLDWPLVVVRGLDCPLVIVRGLDCPLVVVRGLDCPLVVVRGLDWPLVVVRGLDCPLVVDSPLVVVCCTLASLGASFLGEVRRLGTDVVLLDGAGRVATVAKMGAKAVVVATAGVGAAVEVTAVAAVLVVEAVATGADGAEPFTIFTGSKLEILPGCLMRASWNLTMSWRAGSSPLATQSIPSISSFPSHATLCIHRSTTACFSLCVSSR